MNSGGWYIERNEKAQTDLLAAVPMLVCAFGTLDRHCKYTGPSPTLSKLASLAQRFRLVRKPLRWYE